MDWIPHITQTEHIISHYMYIYVYVHIYIYDIYQVTRLAAVETDKELDVGFVAAAAAAVSALLLLLLF